MRTAISVAPGRWLRTTEGAASSTRSESACLPRRPSATPNSTRVPPRSSVTPAGRAEAGTWTSSPSSVWANPKPLVES